MANQKRPDDSTWSRSSDDLIYEELLARYAIDTDKEPPSKEDPSSVKTSHKKKEDPFLSQLVREISEGLDEGKYSKKRGAASKSGDPLPPQETRGWKVSATGTAAPGEVLPPPIPPRRPSEPTDPKFAQQTVPPGNAAAEDKRPEPETRETASGEVLPPPIPPRRPSEPMDPKFAQQAAQPVQPDNATKGDEVLTPVSSAPISKQPENATGPMTADKPKTALPGAGTKTPGKSRKAAEGEQLVSLPYSQRIYDEMYDLGLQLLDSFGSLHQRLNAVFGWLSAMVPAFLEKVSERLRMYWKRLSDSTLFPYRDISQKTEGLRHDLRAAKKQGGTLEGRTRGNLLWRYFSSLIVPFNYIVNSLAPIIGFTVLAACIIHFSGLNYGLSVEYAGYHLGYISDENVFYSAQEAVLDRLIYEESPILENNRPIFQLAVVDRDAFLDREGLANKILAVSNNEVESADGIYIEGVFLGAIRDGREFLMYLDNLLDGYRTGADYEVVQFIKGISVRQGIYPVSSLRALPEIRDTLNSDQPLETIHTVRATDTLAAIALSYNVTTDQILNLNPELEDRIAADTLEVIAPSGGSQGPVSPLGEDAGPEEEPGPKIDLVAGEQLLISRVDPGLGIQVTLREIYMEDVAFGIDYVDNANIYEGTQTVLSAGIRGKQEVTADVTYIDGERIGEKRVDVQSVSKPVNQRISRGTRKIITVLTPNAVGQNADSYVWPVEGGTNNGSLGSYYGHTGLDIGAPQGTVIRAARAGTVTYATNLVIWPYGRSIVISHGDGSIARYAHCYSVVVSVGQYVEQGQYIGTVGRTGNATGNHLHFEIRVNGVIRDPQLFVGRRYNGIWG